MTELGNQLETEKDREVFQKAYQLFTRKPDWVTFFRNVLGVSGIVRKNYTNREEMARFEQTEAYAQIQQMLSKLREERVSPSTEGSRAQCVSSP